MFWYDDNISEQTYHMFWYGLIQQWIKLEKHIAKYWKCAMITRTFCDSSEQVDSHLSNSLIWSCKTCHMFIV